MTEKLKSYILTLCFGLFAASLLVVITGGLNGGVGAFLISLCNSCFAVGVCMLCVGVLTVANSNDFFDMFKYSFITLWHVLGIKKKKYRDFYEYKNSKQKREANCSHTLFSGALFVGISLIFTFIYYAVI